MQKVVLSNPIEGNMYLLQLIDFIKWHVKNCFVKLIEN